MLIARAFPSIALSEPRAKFLTYSNYFRYVRQCIRSVYGKNRFDNIQAAFATAKQRTNVGVRHANVRDDKLRKILFNAWNTHLVANCSFELEERIFPIVLHWLPVQYYYSIYFTTSALAYGYNGILPENHQTVLNMVNAYGRTKNTFLPPWNLQYDATANQPHINFPDGFTPAKISNLSMSEDNPLDSIAKFLRTTYRDRCEAQWDGMGKAARRDWRRQGKKKADVTVKPVSLFDCFYRLRKWANYAEAEAMLTGPSSDADVASFANDLKAVHSATVYLLELHLIEMFGLKTLRPIATDYRTSVGRRIDLGLLKSREILNASATALPARGNLRQVYR